ncbi:LamG domain-containing protein [Microbulbifer sp. CAU 1566]|uniref:LamG domain-containing protein n=1 Tax=Microbulbifer sp. CAU 1566 TaxID=2933269 RepID=UPI002004B6F4|nr:LamG domain-containing protein [Microbulbifer sp. CAU 1566]MCK7597814.1 LamG domain-containing protein [Microbulbifer sp. CAU 1566]
MYNDTAQFQLSFSTLFGRPQLRKAALRKTALLSCVFASALLVACSGGSGQATEELPNTNPDSGDTSYSGPAPESEDVQNYKRYIWDNLAAENRCGSCHIEGNQSPRFVRGDDVNLAHGEGRELVNLGSPEDSRLVTKVASGHNCWLASPDACAEIITNYIEEWASAAGSVASSITLTAPTERDVGASKSFPASSANFATTVYPLLEEYCSGCHSEDAGTAQQPYIASADIDQAYEAAKARMDLDSPEKSRLVVRLGTDFHNCWSNCSENADTMAAAIKNFVDGIAVTEVDPNWVISKALYLTDGIVASGGGRIENNAIALYEFKSGSGTVAYDTSGVNPAINLNLSGDVEWLGSWGIQLNGGKAQGATATSKRLFDTLSGTGEYTIEAWVAPANVVQEGPARIVSYSGGNDIRNFTLGQAMYNYTFQNRNDASTDANGMPALITEDMAERAQATLQHVVATFDPINGRRLYVNGEFTGDADPVAPGLLSTWDDTFALVLGSEASNDFAWQGSIRLLAIHSRALNQDDILTNFEAGVGEKYMLLFKVEEQTDVPQGYVMFEVQQYDNHGYLFSEPKFITLEDGVTPDGVVIQGMRIGINGREAVVGQAWANLDTTVTATDYNPASGQKLSPLGTIITLEKGPTSDEFFLTFERLGNEEFVRIEATPAAPAAPADLAPQPRIGIRRFEQIHAALSAATGISSANSAVVETWEKVKQQLPVEADVRGFLAAQQMGITQLAVKYCSTLVDDTSARASYFPGFDFSAAASSAFDTDAKRAQIIDPLLEKLLGRPIAWPAAVGGHTAQLATAPDENAVRAELDELINIMTTCSSGTACDAARTATTVKATCAAAMGSAMILIH